MKRALPRLGRSRRSCCPLRAPRPTPVAAGLPPVRPVLHLVPRGRRQGLGGPSGRRGPAAHQDQDSRASARRCVGVGALAADFYLRTGYMPLAARRHAAAPPPRLPERARDQGARRLRRVARAGPGDPDAAPRARQPLAGLPPLHRALRRLPPGRRRGRLRHRGAPAAARGRDADAGRGGRADRPLRDADVLEEGRSPTASSTRSSRYVEYAKHPDDRGGWAIGHIGPMPEGFVTWFIGMTALVAVCMVIGKRLQRG